jgi:preprotein translocase subunit SecA
MSFNDILSKLFGNKSQRDLKEIDPYVQKILAVYPSVEKLSNDELRARSNQLMDYIQEKIEKNKEKIEELKATIEDLE